MATRFAQKQLIIPDENFDVHPKKSNTPFFFFFFFYVVFDFIIVVFLTKLKWVCFVEANVDGKVNGLKKTTTKKGDRRALNDITNKSSNIRIEDTLTTKKNVPEKEELFDVAQEMFLHDHKKCIESHQQSGMNSFYLDLVLPGHGN